MRKYTCKKAFTMAEMVIAVSLVTILAAMLVPIVSDNTNEDKLLAVTKNSAAELSLAYATFLKTNVPDSNTGAWPIIQNMNYVRTINNDSLSVQSNGANNSCSANQPCLLLQNGALLQYDQAATFGNPPADAITSAQFAINTRCWLCDRPSSTTNPHPNINALRFILDPDGNGREEGVTLVLFFGGRVTTWSMANEAFFTEVNALNADRNDPKYVWYWINS